MKPMPTLILASSSAYRRELLGRLYLPFEANGAVFLSGLGDVNAITARALEALAG